MHNVEVVVLIGIAIVVCVIWVIFVVSETKRKNSHIDAGSNYGGDKLKDNEQINHISKVTQEGKETSPKKNKDDAFIACLILFFSLVAAHIVSIIIESTLTSDYSTSAFEIIAAYASIWGKLKQKVIKLYERNLKKNILIIVLGVIATIAIGSVLSNLWTGSIIAIILSSIIFISIAVIGAILLDELVPEREYQVEAEAKELKTNDEKPVAIKQDEEAKVKEQPKEKFIKKERLKLIARKCKKPIIIGLSVLLLSFVILFSIVKWGIPISDKEILDSAIRREFMFKELHMSSRSATKILMRDHMLEDYISLARQEADIVQYARLRRYLNSRSSDSLKSTIYHWNYKLNE
jgi:hypothetical protein